MTFPIYEHNRLIKTESGVWISENSGPIDGSEEDFPFDRVRNILEHSCDLTSTSVELEKTYADWDFESEFHLSPRRANLLRGLSLAGIGCALELGCGCGAITRYLGEFNIQVDAVESSAEKAELARIRCRDLGSVEVIHSNTQNLKLPKNGYDAVFLIGFLDHTKEALNSLLSNALSALKTGGVLFIAAENRLGLKYWLGASEPHYRIPYMGLYGYPKANGIRTYDQKEWKRILNKAGINHYRYSYPFPDYQFPKVVLSDSYIQNDGYAYSTLYRVLSQDRFRAWTPDADEYLIWKALHRSGHLEEFSNSFLIAASDSKERLDHVMVNDFVFFSDYGRRPAFRTMTVKPSDREYIAKQNLLGVGSGGSEIEAIKQSLSKKKYHKGNLLSDLWQEAIVECQDTISFETLLKTYRDFIFEYLQQSTNTENAIDILPFNIIVSEDGSYHVIDDEWVLPNVITPEYIIFRALMWFGKNSGMLLRRLCEIKKIADIRKFIEYGFQVLSFEPGNKIDEFVGIEEKLQTEVNFQKGLNNIRRMIDEPFRFWAIDESDTLYSGQLFWAGEKKDFSENKSVYATAPVGNDRQLLVFPFFVFENKLQWLKLKPVNHPGFFMIYNISLKWMDAKRGKEEILLRLTDPSQIADTATLENVIFCKTDQGGVFLSANREPYFTFELKNQTKIDIGGGTLTLEIEIDRPKSADYFIAEKTLVRINSLHQEDKIRELEKRKKIVKKIQAQHQQIQAQHQQIQAQHQQIRLENVQAYRYKNRIHHLELRNQKTSNAFESIKSNQYWKGFRTLKKISRVMHGSIHVLEKAVSSPYHRTYQLIRQTPIFDASYYLSQNPEVEITCEDPIRHYIKTGAREGRKPGPLFDTDYYMKQNPDVASSGKNPLEHFLTAGAKEGRKPNPVFDTTYYISNNSGIAKTGMNPLEHYLKAGVKEGKDPHPLFSTSYYLSHNPDVERSGMNPLAHYLEGGADEGRNPGPLFDTDHYLSEHFKAIEHEVNPLVHYLDVGVKEGRDPCPLFNSSYYLSKNPGAVKSGMNALEHFLIHGAKEGKNPNPIFDTAYYMEQNPDVVKSGMNPLVHYLENGAKERRNPGPLFDTNYYLSKNQDVLTSGINPLVHYLETGGVEGRDPSPLFSGSYYLSKNPDVLTAGINPLVHYTEHGGKEGRNPSPLFDAAYYLSKNPGILGLGKTPLEHYLTVGAPEGKNPNPIFDTAYYMEQNPDVVKSGMNPLVHYLKNGAKEGRNPGPLFDTNYYLEQNPDVAKSGMNPLAHYLQHGGIEGRDPNPIFCSSFYLAENPDLLEIGENPLVHFIELGARQGRNPCSFFDTTYYVNQNPDVFKSGINPLAHYLMHGIAQGKKPNPILDNFLYKPLISIVKYIKDNNEKQFQKQMISATSQIYQKLELVILVDTEAKEDITSMLHPFIKRDKRIKVVDLEKKADLPSAFNRGISVSTGEFLFFLNDSVMRVEALYEYVGLLNKNPHADLIFCDQGEPDAVGFRVEDYARPDLLLSLNYFVGSYLLFRKSIIDEIGGIGTEHGGPQDRDFLLRYVGKTKPERIFYISKRLINKLRPL